MKKNVGPATQEYIQDKNFEAVLAKQGELTPEEKRNILLASYFLQGQEDARDGVSREEFCSDDEGILEAYNNGYENELAKQALGASERRGR